MSASGAQISFSDHPHPFLSSGPARSLTLWVPVRDTIGPLRSWLPAVTACCLGTSSAPRLPPFSGHGAAELRAGLRGRSLTCRPRPAAPPTDGCRSAAYSSPRDGTPRPGRAPPTGSRSALSPCQSHREGHAPRHTPPPRPAPLPRRPPQQSGRPGKATPPNTPLHPAGGLPRTPRAHLRPCVASDSGPFPSIQYALLHAQMRLQLVGGGRRRQPGAARNGGKALVLFIMTGSIPIYE